MQAAKQVNYMFPQAGGIYPESQRNCTALGPSGAGKSTLLNMLALEGKITQNKALHKLLLETHPHKLVNVGSTDPEWGAGSAGCAGKNLLGELLMQLRQTLVDAASRPRSATPWRLEVDKDTP